MLEQMRHHVAMNRYRVTIDFGATRKMYSDGTLLLLAEVDRLRRRFGPLAIRGTYPTDLVVEQVLHQVGLLPLLGLSPRRKSTNFPDDVKHWRFAAGALAQGEEVQPIVSEYEGVLAKSLTKGLYAGIVEAMTNCLHHAHTGPRDDGLGFGRESARWWMFSQERDGNLTVALCDLGIGIPRSLATSKKWPQEMIARIMRTLSIGTPHASAIKAAIELRRTSTGLEHRGNGLPEILDVVRRGKSGYLRILSDQGVYRYDAADDKETLRDARLSVRGTVIQWTIPLPEKKQ